jgi:hypothetical protein
MESNFSSQVKLDFIINNVVLISRCFGKKMALLVLRRVGLRVGQNQMCHFVRWKKIINIGAALVSAYSLSNCNKVGMFLVTYQNGLSLF